MNYLDTTNWEKTVHDYEFTRKARHQIHEVVTADSFADMPSEEIFQFLLKEISTVSFKDYLKRYLYERAGIEEPFHQVQDCVWQDIIEGAFEENNAPHSFEPTTTRWNTTVKSWLNSERVRRNTVFLLGFGLRMDEEDVEDFLAKVLEEDRWHMDDIREVIFRYCFRHRFPYSHALALQRQYGESAAVSSSEKEMPEDDDIFRDDVSVLKYLHRLNNTEDDIGKNKTSIWFEALYNRTKSIIVSIYNQDEQEKPERERYQWTEADITPADLEKMLYSGIPVTESGNLAKTSLSLLNKQFQSYRLSRQRMDSLLKGKNQPDRFDLITLCFFIHAQKENLSGQERIIGFLEDINHILTDVGRNGIHPANPYEAFILICILSECPLSVYGDIWELSYPETCNQS